MVIYFPKEKRFKLYAYGDMYMEKDNIDRRLVIKFHTLNENQEKAIINELISFIYYFT